MSEKPILFSGPMVRAILEGRKTMTRRVVKPQPEGELRPIEEWSNGIAHACHDHNPDADKLKAHADKLRGNIFPFRQPSGRLMGIRPPYRPGDILWVRETWALNSDLPAEEDREIHRAIWPPEKVGELVGPFIWYRADGDKGSFAGKWRPSIFMPRWASRITLEVTGVRVETLQEITEEDAKREGIRIFPFEDSVAYSWKDNDKTGHASATGAFHSLWDSINGKKYPWASNPFCWVIEFRRIPADRKERG